jgi:hypothetical protein
MKNRSGNGNTTGLSFTTAVIEENPYLQRTTDEQQAPANAENEVFDPAEEDEEGSAIELADERKKVRQRRRRLTWAAVAVLLLVSVVVVLMLYYRSSTRVEYGQTAKQSRVVPPVPNASTTTGRDTRTEQAIEEAQRLTADTGQGTVASHTTPSTTATKGATTDATHDSSSRLDTPFNVPTNFGGTVKTKPDTPDSRTKTDTNNFTDRSSGAPTQTDATTDATNDTRAVRSQRNHESSLYTTERADQRSQSTVGGSVRPNSRTLSARETRTATAVVLPSFGSMLPVRTIGGLYTLRSGALTRLELTRDMNGNGWSMKRGTILVGTSRGGDYDRAYVSIVGFIDPQSGKLVKLGGDVLSGDGGAGLKGKRRQLDGGWARVLAQVGTAALNVTGALVGGRGNGTVIISDGLRTRAVNPVTDEISGVIGGQMDQKQRRGFVEVVAGTPGYVMVTDLPAVIKGTEASPELDGEHLALLTDVDAARPATGLSERELADLLATGSPEEIKAAMPRMSPEMRTIATAVLDR